MIYLLYIALGYLFINSLILYLNFFDFTPLKKSEENSERSGPLVSVCIPARNEQAVIERAVSSVLKQDYAHIEIIVLDDQSTDATPDILKQLQKINQESLKVIIGKYKPNSWLGKSWACHQLSQKVSGERIIFMDADVWLEPGAVNQIVQSMEKHAVDFLTVWPVQHTGTFWERTVIPIVYYGLLSLLPARYVHQTPSWIPSSMENRVAPKFAAACGQCMVFKTSTYKSIGGHQSVKKEIVEDVALAKEVKQSGFDMRMYHGSGAVHCRMYTSGSAMWQGFRKNFLPLYNNSISVFSLMALLNFIVYVLPFIALPFALWTANTTVIILSGIAVSVIILHRLFLSWWYSFSFFGAFTHPLGVLWFHMLGLQVLADYFKGHAPEWKDRPT